MKKIEQDILGLVVAKHYQEDEKLQALKVAVQEYVSDRDIESVKDKVSMIFLLAAIMKLPEKDFYDVIERVNVVMVVRGIEEQKPKH